MGILVIENLPMEAWIGLGGFWGCASGQGAGLRVRCPSGSGSDVVTSRE